ncbi:MAG: translesion error-prone DNA polymerase V autoproteolytic subunit [Prolixibacteraceae bacterium]|nr:translesion error-prone DNA polymerase V autoproteolytic subunit [Prolixibacteraceae bacterium]MBN2650042.1 translesion error-prone DNA polymerase V autoproteolytic subunit [Prolixibacteraceae bacterium]
MITIKPMVFDTEFRLPLMLDGISAGFPSPAQDFIDTPIDLNKELIKNPSSTFFGRVSGDSMKNAGMDDGDLLVIDKSIRPRDGMIAVCFLDGEFIMKQIQFSDNVCWLIAANEQYAPIKVSPDNTFVIWGIVKHVIKSF